MILERYVSRRLVTNLTIVLMIITTLSLTFELMEEGDNVARRSTDVVPAIARYVVLRLPEVATELLPFAVLIGAIIALGLLVRHGEIVAIWNSGISVLGIMRAVLPIGLILVVLQFVIQDRVVPVTRAALQDWGVGKSAQNAGMLMGDMQSVWLLTDNNDVVHIPASAATENHFENLEIFRRDAAGQLSSYLHAENARRDGSNWLLSTVTQRSVNPPAIETIPYMDWLAPKAVEHIPLISKLLKDLRIDELWQLVVHDGYGQRSPELYRTWLHYRIASAFGPLLLLFLVVSLAQRFQRTGTFVRLLIFSVGIGFVFMVVAGMSLSMGEAGLLPPVIAAWGPNVLLATVIARFAIAGSG